jgi:hypothetical protein
LETLDAVRKGDVDWSLLPSDSRPTLRRILRCCLEKDRAQRIQTSGELRIELAKLQQETQDAVRWYNRFKWTGDFRLPLGYSQTRLLFLLTQLPYVIGYLMVFYHWDHYDLDNALERNFMIPVDVSLPAIRLMSLIGFAIRVYFISLAGWKHHLAAHRFSQVFYAVLVLDGLWAATPLLISQWATKLVAWPGVILMVWLTFGQRSAMLSLERQSSVAGSTGAKR